MPDQNQDSPIISTLNSQEFPALLSMMSVVLLFRLCGEQTFDLHDMQTIINEYEGIRVTTDVNNNTITFTLRSQLEKNQKGKA